MSRRKPRAKAIGKALLKLLEECEKLGFHQMVAVIGDGQGNRGSVALHESLGFKHCGSIEGSGFKLGRWVDTVFMQYELNGGAAKLPDAAQFSSQRLEGAVAQPRPINGILVAITVMNCTLASSGSEAM